MFWIFQKWKDKSLLRQILKTSQNIIWDVYKQENTTNILESIEKNIFDLTQSQTWNNIQHINEIMGWRTKEYMAIVDDPEKVNSTKVFSGYKKLDEMLGGFKPGELIIIAARPSMGKTSFALKIVTNIALQQDKSIAIFSLEMGAESIVDRIIAEVAQIPMSKITKGDLNNDDFSKIWEAMTILWDKKIYIDDKSAANIPLLKSNSRLKVEKWELDLVIITTYS